MRWFAEAQMRDPTLQLDPAEFPRDVLELWAEARNLGMLIVDTEPAGVEVSVDGVARGRSPLGVAGLRPGAYQVTLAHAGYAGVSRVLSVAAGRTERLFVPMLPASGAADPRTRGAAPLTGTRDGVSTAGLSFGDAAAEQAPVNVFPIPDRFPAGTTKKSGRSWWRTLAGLLGVAGGVATIVQGVQCRAVGAKKSPGGRRVGGEIEILGGRLSTAGFSPKDRIGCKSLLYNFYWESSDGPEFEGIVWDHASVESGTDNPFLDAREYNMAHELVRQMREDPSVAPRLHQALMESVGDIRAGYVVPPEWLVPGAAMVGFGALLATLWADVTVVGDLAVSVTPTGGVLASRSFGW